MIVKIRNREVEVDDYEFKRHVTPLTEDDFVMYVAAFFGTSLYEEFIKELPQDELELAINGMLKEENSLIWKEVD